MSMFWPNENEPLPPCEKCRGVGLVYLMPDGHEIECPHCEGSGVRHKDEDDDNENSVVRGGN